MSKKYSKIITNLLQRNSLKKLISIKKKLNPVAVVVDNRKKFEKQPQNYLKYVQQQLHDLFKQSNQSRFNIKEIRQNKVKAEVKKKLQQLQQSPIFILRRLELHFQIPNLIQTKEYILSLNPKDQGSMEYLTEFENIIYFKLHTLKINQFVKELAIRTQIEILNKKYQYSILRQQNEKLSSLLSKLVKYTKEFAAEFPNSDQSSASEHLYWQLEHANYLYKNNQKQQAISNQNINEILEIKKGVLEIICSYLKENQQIEQLKNIYNKLEDPEEKQIAHSYIDNQNDKKQY